MRTTLTPQQRASRICCLGRNSDVGLFPPPCLRTSGGVSFRKLDSGTQYYAYIAEYPGNVGYRRINIDVEGREKTHKLWTKDLHTCFCQLVNSWACANPGEEKAIVSPTNTSNFFMRVGLTLR